MCEAELSIITRPITFMRETTIEYVVQKKVDGHAEEVIKKKIDFVSTTMSIQEFMVEFKTKMEHSIPHHVDRSGNNVIGPGSSDISRAARGHVFRILAKITQSR